MNVSMISAIENEEGVCVRKIGEEIFPGVYKLNHFENGKDYFDSKNGVWMRRIVSDGNGNVMAVAEDYTMDGWKSLWKRL